jgi:hypothetical protein
MSSLRPRRHSAVTGPRSVMLSAQSSSTAAARCTSHPAGLIARLPMREASSAAFVTGPVGLPPQSLDLAMEAVLGR